MWKQENIPLVSPIAIQKRLPFAISINELSNFIGNLSLSPHAIPVSNRTKYILHAVIKELLIQERIKVEEQKYEIPDYLVKICANTTESSMIILDSLMLPDWCELEKETRRIASIVQVHATNGIVKGTCTLDFGLNEKQIIHLTTQTLIRIPVATTSKLKIRLELTQGRSSVAKRQSFEIHPSEIGLIIDTRETDILIKSNASHAKELVCEWLQSFDLAISDI